MAKHTLKILQCWHRKIFKACLADFQHARKGLNYISLQELARTISHIFATFLDVTYGPLHYRHLQRNKILGI